MRRLLTASLMLLAASEATTAVGQGTQPETNAPKLPELRVVGAATDGLKLTSTVADIDRTIVVESTNKVAASGVRISLAPLVGADPTQAVPHWTIDGAAGTNAIAIPGLGETRVRLTATLPAAGTYTSAVTLVYADRRVTVPLVITRTLAPLSVRILGAQTIRRDSGDVTLRFTVEETAAHDVTLQSPIVLVAQVDTAKTRSQARYVALAMTGPNGAPLKWPLTVPALTSKDLEVRINGLSPGEYEGTLRLAGKDAQPVEQTFTMQIRQSCGWPVVPIAFGVGLSFVIRRWAKSGRPRLIAQRRLAVLRGDADRVAQQLHEDERPALDALERRLDRLDDEFAVGVPANADIVFDEIDRKLSLIPAWVTIRRRIATVEPGLRASFETQVAAVTTAMEREGMDAAAAQTASQTLTTLDAAITTTIRTDLLQRLQTFETEVQGQAATIQDPLVLARLNEVRLRIDAARAAVGHGDFGTAREAFGGGRALFARVLAEHLSRTIAASNMPPPGLDGPSWSRLQAQVAEEIAPALREGVDAETAIRGYRSAYARYLRGILRGLQTALQSQRSALPGIGALTEAQRTAFTSRIDAALQHVVTGLAKLDAADLPGAVTEYDEAHAESNAVRADVAKAGGQLGLAGIEVGQLVTAALMVPATIRDERVQTVRTRELRGPMAAATLAQRLRTADAALSVAALLIAVVLGVSLLWVSNNTWGAPADWIAAVLWGLGLHQVAGATFEGATATVERMGR